MTTTQRQWKARNVRVPDDLWEAAQSKAHDQSENLSELMRHWLRNYVADEPVTVGDSASV